MGSSSALASCVAIVCERTSLVVSRFGRRHCGWLTTGIGRTLNAAHGILRRSGWFGFSDFGVVRMMSMTSMFCTQRLYLKT